jgi:hypothetical protein
LSVIGKGSTGVQGNGRTDNQSDYFHLLPHEFFKCPPISGGFPLGKPSYARTRFQSLGTN